MSEAKVDKLLKVEAGLTRSFIGCVVVVLASIFWGLFVADTSSGVAEPVAVTLLLLALQIGFYVWYAIAAGAAAKVLGESGWKYVAWILAAPLLAQIPIPIVSTIIGVSPLSIKFLLGGQLHSAIRAESFADFHQPV